MYDKIWESHLVRDAPGEPSLIYIDRHLVHEGTSPQAFAGIEAAGRKVRRPDLTFAVMDHSVPTKNRELPHCGRQLRGCSSRRWRATARSTACTSSTCSAAIRASCTSLDPNWASRSPALPSSAAIATLQRMERLGRWPSALEPAKWSMCWLRNASSRTGRKPCWSIPRQAPAGRLFKGPHPGAHRQDRHFGRHRPRDRIRGRGHQRALDGCAHDHLQYDHRGRRARGDGGAGRNNL